MVIVDRASLLLIQALLGLYKVQEQSWRLLELHSIKIVSSGIIWVSLQEVGIPGASLPLNDFVGLCHTHTSLIALFLLRENCENHSLQRYSGVKENCCDHLFNRFL